MNFWNISLDEAAYRLDENLSRLPRRMRWLAPRSGGYAVACPTMRDKKMNCPCLGHMEKREKLEKFLRHFEIKK